MHVVAQFWATHDVCRAQGALEIFFFMQLYIRSTRLACCCAHRNEVLPSAPPHPADKMTHYHTPEHPAALRLALHDVCMYVVVYIHPDRAGPSFSTLAFPRSVSPSRSRPVPVMIKSLLALDRVPGKDDSVHGGQGFIPKPPSLSPKTRQGSQRAPDRDGSVHSGMRDGSIHGGMRDREGSIHGGMRDRDGSVHGNSRNSFVAKASITGNRDALIGRQPRQRCSAAELATSQVMSTADQFGALGLSQSFKGTQPAPAQEQPPAPSNPSQNPQNPQDPGNPLVPNRNRVRRGSDLISPNGFVNAFEEQDQVVITQNEYRDAGWVPSTYSELMRKNDEREALLDDARRYSPLTSVFHLQKLPQTVLWRMLCFPMTWTLFVVYLTVALLTRYGVLSLGSHMDLMTEAFSGADVLVTFMVVFYLGYCYTRHFEIYNMATAAKSTIVNLCGASRACLPITARRKLFMHLNLSAHPQRSNATPTGPAPSHLKSRDGRYQDGVRALTR